MDNNQYSGNNQYQDNSGSSQYSSPQYNAPQYGSYSRPTVQQSAPTIQFGEGNTVYSSAGSSATQGSYRPQNSNNSGGSSLVKGIVIGCVIACLMLGIIGGVVSIIRANVVESAPEEKVELEINESPTTDTTISAAPGQQLTYAQIAEKVKRAVVGVSVYTNAYGWGSYIYSEGTGFIINKDGYIVTNSHVIQDDDYDKFSITVSIVGKDGTNSEYEVEVIGQDTRTDLAVLRLKEKVDDLVVAELGDSTALVLGDEVVAIGNPGGAQFAGSVTNGIVSGLDRIIDDPSTTSSESAMKYLQTNAAINPGNSGGPLLNMYGQVIGINTAKIAADGYEGLGFAIPMATAKPIIEQIIEVGSVVRPVLGITCSEITEQMSNWYDVPQGIMIREINARSGLIAAGVQVGDIITACDGESVTNLGQLQTIIEQHEVGEKITLSLFRPGTGAYDAQVELIADRLG